MKALLPEIKVIVVLTHEGEPYVSQALAAGAREYVVKDHLVTDLVPAVAEALGVAPAANFGCKHA